MTISAFSLCTYVPRISPYLNIGNYLVERIYEKFIIFRNKSPFSMPLYMEGFPSDDKDTPTVMVHAMAVFCCRQYIARRHYRRVNYFKGVIR